MNPRHLRQLAWAGVSDLLFAVGLVVSGMTRPAKVLGFLNVAGLVQGVSSTAQPGLWDPSLAFVMAGALLVTLLAFHYTPQRTQPTAGDKFHLPTRQDIDRRLLLGAVLFGLGWAWSTTARGLPWRACWSAAPMRWCLPPPCCSACGRPDVLRAKRP